MQQEIILYICFHKGETDFAFHPCDIIRLFRCQWVRVVFSAVIRYNKLRKLKKE
jgi:hypothetical protein